MSLGLRMGLMRAAVPRPAASGVVASGVVASGVAASGSAVVAGPGFVRRRIRVPIGSGAPDPGAPRGRRPDLLGGAVDHVRLPDAATFAANLAAVAAVPRAGLPASRPAVLLDLETTGLGRDAGCVPFMVGLAWHETDDDGTPCLAVHQWILSRLSAEAAMLQEVATLLDGPDHAHAALVTYNGASFDLPLLRARWVRHRITRPGARTAVDGRPHFDLLVAARRLWKGRSPDCRLSTLERLQLSVLRQDDVHGSDIAEAYWQWLRTPDDPQAVALLDRIEAHNRVDLVSLAGLAAEIGERLLRPQGLADVVRAADHHARQQRPALALTVLEGTLRALRRSGVQHSPLRRQAALLGAELLRKTAAHDDAAALWALVCRATPGDPDAHDRLAKHFEHRLRDPSAALTIASQSAAPCPRRIARLTEKVAASGAAPVGYAVALARAAPV